MRELSNEAVSQLQEQLERLAAPEGEPVPSRSPAEAMIETTFLGAAADGKVTPLEVAQFAEAVESVLGDESDGDVEALVQRMAGRLEAEGWDKRLEAVRRAFVGTEHAAEAYRLAAAVALVGSVGDAEQKALDAIAAAFGIAPEQARSLADAVKSELYGDG